MDPIIRIAAISTLILSSLLMMKSSRNWRWTVCLGLLIICVTSYVMDNGVTQILRPSGMLADITQLLTKCIIGILWLFLMATFEEGFRFRRAYIALTLFWCVIGFLGLPNWDWGALSGPLNAVTIFAGLGLMAHALWVMQHGASGDFRIFRKEARFWVGIVLSGAILIDIIVDLSLGYAWRAPAYILGQNLAIGLTASALVLYVWQADLSDFMGQDKRAETHIQTKDPAASQIISTMRSQQLFLRPDLRLADFAKAIDLNESELRRAINHELGFGHFTSFVNHFRVEHAKSLLKDPSRTDDKIIAIAFDSGFASLPSFQRVFKAIVGKTPTEWKNEKV